MGHSSASTSGPLASWLADLRIRHTFLVVGKLGGSAGVQIEPEGAAAFHYCHHGSCVVEAIGHAPIHLDAGDYLFMRVGLARTVWADDGVRRSRSVALRTLVSSVEPDAAVTFEIGTASHIVIGGGFCIDSPEARMFVGAMPEVFCVRRGAAYADRLNAVLHELIEEATTGTPDAGPVIARLSEVAALIAVRSFSTTDRRGAPLLEAARDPQLGRALAAIQREPARAWTIAQLGRVAGMSRSGFAAAFTQAVGETPVAYLARVRMVRAERLLIDEDWSLPRIAEAVGYASTAAFSVAFKRVRGVPPGELRRLVRLTRTLAA